MRQQHRLGMTGSLSACQVRWSQLGPVLQAVTGKLLAMAPDCLVDTSVRCCSRVGNYRADLVFPKNTNVSKIHSMKS